MVSVYVCVYLHFFMCVLWVIILTHIFRRSERNVSPEGNTSWIFRAPFATESLLVFRRLCISIAYLYYLVWCRGERIMRCHFDGGDWRRVAHIRRVCEYIWCLFSSLLLCLLLLSQSHSTLLLFVVHLFHHFFYLEYAWYHHLAFVETPPRI